MSLSGVIDRRVTGLEMCDDIRSRRINTISTKLVHMESLWSLLQSTKALVYTLTAQFHASACSIWNQPG